MSEALAETRPVTQLSRWSTEQRDLIKRTVAPDATDDELAMFLHIAGKSGLDPLQRQIHFTKRSGRVTIIAGIDGLQARAAREADFEGIIYGVVCQKDDFAFDATKGEVVKHTYNAFGDRGGILGAWATVRRRGKLPFTATVRFSEYNQAHSPTWKQMPHVMLAKVARSTALRLAYPEQFGGLYEQAEMDQVDVTRDVPMTGVSRVLASLRAQLPPDAPSDTAHPEETLPPELPPASLELGDVKGIPLMTLTDERLAELSQAARKWLGNPRNQAVRPAMERDLAKIEAELSTRLATH